MTDPADCMAEDAIGNRATVISMDSTNLASRAAAH